MKPLAINLLPELSGSRQSWPGQRPWLWLMFAALGVAAAGHQLLRVIELRAQLRAASEQSYALAAQQASAAPSTPATPSTPAPYLDDARSIAAMAAFDVAGVLKALESLREPGLRVVSAVIDAKERRVRIDVEVSDLAPIARALETLNQGEPQPLWRLLQAQAGAAGQPARATLEMRR